MDVRYNNILESTRQYFQGVPVNNVNKAGQGEELPPQNDQRVDGRRLPEYLGPVPPPTSRTYWVPQNEMQKNDNTLLRQLPLSGDRKAENRPPQSNLLPPIAALSSTATSNYRPFSSEDMDKIAQWRQFHSKPSTITANHATPSTAVPTIPYYSPLSSQVSATSSSAIYYPAPVQASTSKNAHYYHHPPNDIPINRSRTTHFPNSRESGQYSQFSLKTNSYPIDSKQESKSFSSSSNPIFPGNSGFRPPVPSPKPASAYLTPNESLQLASKIIHTNASVSGSKTTMSLPSYGSNQNLYSMNSVTSQANYQPEMSKRGSSSRHSSSKLNVNTAPAAPGSASALGYSVPKMQPAAFHQSTIQVNPKLNIDITRENSSLFSHKSSPGSISHILHEGSKKLHSFPKTTMQPVASENKKKSTTFPVHYASITPVINERGKSTQQRPSNNDLDHDMWASKNTLLKRESPLDLSVKTIRQSADSTAKDEQENGSYSLPGFQTLDCRIRPQTSESYAPIGLPGFSYSSNRTESMASAPGSDFPRASFNPLFNIHLQPHHPGLSGDRDKNYLRTSGSDRGIPQQRVDLHPNSGFLQNCQRSQRPEEVIMKQFQPQHLSSQPIEGNIQSRSSSNQNYSSHLQHLNHVASLVENSVNNLPAASTYLYSKSVLSNSSDPHLGKKRPLPVDAVYESKAKSPKVDSWLKTIDQQIEEKFSSYVTSRANDHCSSTPNTAPSNANRPAVDKNAENLSRNNAEVRYLPSQEERTFPNVKALEVASACSKPSANLVNVREPYPQPIAGDHPNQQSVVRNYEPVGDYSFKPECGVFKKEERSCSGISNEKFDNSLRIKHPAADPKLSFTGREDQEKSMPRPRTKAELKQVESNSEFSTPEFQGSSDNPSTSSSKTTVPRTSTSSSSEDVESGESKSQGEVVTPPSLSCVSPPKLTEEQMEKLPRKKLPEEVDEIEDALNASDACIFDFRDSDSEHEMPVLERQTLHEMRRERDRRISSKMALSNENLSAEKVEAGEPSSPHLESKDPFWMETCDSFLEQLTTTPMQKIKKASKKRLKNDSESPDSIVNNTDNLKKSLGKNDSISNKMKDEILFRDNSGIPKVVVKDFKKEEEKRFSNLKLEKLSPSELKQEIVQLTNIKKELEEKILESEKTDPTDEVKTNRLHLKKLKSKVKIVKSKDIGNEENIKRSISLKVRKQRRFKRLGSGEAEQTASTKIKSSDDGSTPSKLSDSSSSKLDASSSDSNSRRGKHLELASTLTRRFTLREVGSKSKNSKKLVLRTVRRKDSSDSVLSTESEDSAKRSRSVSSRLDSESSVKHASVDANTKRKMLKRRRASSSIGGRPGLRSATGLRSTKSILNVKRQKQLKNKKRKLSSKSSKQTEIVKNQGHGNDKEPVDAVTEPVHLNKKKFKFKSVRRKFRSSGFDYLRKKKKQMKKAADCDEVKVKKFPAVRAKPESVDELQAEINRWVINKGLGESVLHRAARLGYPDAVAYSLEVMEIAASVRDNAGYTPLHEASHRGHLAIARMLLMYGADSSASAIGGIRPLHEAAENGHLELVRLLLSYGADPLLATYSGQTPISLAHDAGMKNLLEHHLADVQGNSAPKWDFTSLPLTFDDTVSGCDVLSDPPDASLCNDLDVEIEYSENHLPSTFWLIGEPMSDLWAVWQEVGPILRLKSTDGLLKLLGKTNAEVLRELSPSEFASKASNPSIFGATNFKFQSKCQKIVLVKYTEQLRSFMNIEKMTVSSR